MNETYKLSQKLKKKIVSKLSIFLIKQHNTNTHTHAYQK